MRISHTHTHTYIHTERERERERKGEREREREKAIIYVSKLSEREINIYLCIKRDIEREISIER